MIKIRPVSDLRNKFPEVEQVDVFSKARKVLNG